MGEAGLEDVGVGGRESSALGGKPGNSFSGETGVVAVGLLIGDGGGGGGIVGGGNNGRSLLCLQDALFCAFDVTDSPESRLTAFGSGLSPAGVDVGERSAAEIGEETSRSGS